MASGWQGFKGKTIQSGQNLHSIYPQSQSVFSWIIRQTGEARLKPFMLFCQIFCYQSKGVNMT